MNEMMKSIGESGEVGESMFPVVGEGERDRR
jgi:hypothetical protein